MTSESRFFIDHGVIHDRATGKHVVTDGEPPFEDSIEQVCELLNGLVRQAASPSACEVQSEVVTTINARLTDLAEANALYGKDQRLNAPDKIARNEREISWLKDLRSMIVLGAAQEAKHCCVWQPIETAPKDGTEVLVWCDEGPDISQYSDREEDGSDSMGHDAGWWGTRQPMDPGRHMGNPEYFREAENQPWAWMPIEPPYDADGEKLFAAPSVPSAEGK